MEPLLDPNNNRLTIYPIQNQKIWNHYKKQFAAFWTVEEIDFAGDVEDFNNLNENEQHFIKYILAFFAASDTIVNMNLSEKILPPIQIREVIVLYEYQIMMENIHAEAYSLMIENIIKDKEEKSKCFNAINDLPCVQKKMNWALKWIELDDVPFGQRLIANAIVEGVFFSGSFCAIFWLKKKNVMPGLTSSNELIARDEGMHTETAQMLSNDFILNRVEQQTVHEMFIEAVEIEREFICESLPCSLLGMNSDLMYQYIQFVADRLLIELNYDKIWDVENPFDFMESISLEGRTNFFESRPTQYQKSSVLNEGKIDAYEFTEDF